PPLPATGGWLQWTDAAGAMHRWLVDSASSDDVTLHADDSAVAAGLPVLWHWPTAGVADAVDGVRLRVSALALAPRLVGSGVVQRTRADGRIDERRVVRQGGDWLVMDVPLPDLAAADPLVVVSALEFPALAASASVISSDWVKETALSLNGGFVEWQRADGLVESRSIMAASGSTVTLLYGGQGLAVGLGIVARPGCEHSWAACLARGNTINYGGSVYKPVQNPYDGQSMSWG
ncbi:MAG TPA: phage BR0599 family protein, partial [Steroidobacteraceae bacterium]